MRPAVPEVREIGPGDTLELRRQVLWPQLPLEALRLPEDDAGIHWGVFSEGRLVSVLSAFEGPDGVQFRKFATREDCRGRGFGTLLLDRAWAWTQDRGAGRLWCRARTTARGFYEARGLAVVGGPFVKDGVEYVVMERRRGP